MDIQVAVLALYGWKIIHIFSRNEVLRMTLTSVVANRARAFVVYVLFR